MRTVSFGRPTRRAFVGMSAVALLLAACGQPSAAPTAPPSVTKPAEPAKPATSGVQPGGGATGAAAAAPVQAAAKGLVLEISFPDWIIDVNPAVQKLSDEYSQ